MKVGQTEMGISRGDATKKRGFHALPDSEIYTSEYHMNQIKLIECNLLPTFFSRATAATPLGTTVAAS